VIDAITDVRPGVHAGISVIPSGALHIDVGRTTAIPPLTVNEEISLDVAVKAGCTGTCQGYASVDGRYLADASQYLTCGPTRSSDLHEVDLDLGSPESPVRIALRDGTRGTYILSLRLPPRA
jgi:hypothetical protein